MVDAFDVFFIWRRAVAVWPHSMLPKLRHCSIMDTFGPVIKVYDNIVVLTMMSYLMEILYISI